MNILILISFIEQFGDLKNLVSEGNMLTRRVKEVSLLKQNHAPKPSPAKCVKNITKQEDGLFTMYMMNISKSLASFSGYH